MRQDRWSLLLEIARHDLPAGIVVFLVAVPLCLGIAHASGAPLASGLIAGISGGIVVTLISRSRLGVSGPAAGLTVIVLEAIKELGFKPFLLSVVFAGLLQILFGLSRLGIIGYYFPSAVISGMLAGIGVIVILKQIPHAVGYDSDWEGDLSFVELTGETTFSALVHMLGAFHLGAAIIGLISLAILILWEQPFIKGRRIFQLIQGPLVTVTVGALLQLAWKTLFPQLALGPSHLVQLPTEGLSAFITSPDFSAWNNPAIYTTALTLAVVASLETLLCVEAIDKLDPLKRVTPTNRELVAQGFGNMVSGLFGGLPITQVIIRSSTNLLAGARTRASAFTHGLILLVASLFFPHWLNQIPLSALAAVLIMVGYKLASPAVFLRFYRRGWFQFLPFVTTVVVMLFTDLLIGITVGMTVALFAILFEHARDTFYLHEEKENNRICIRLSEHVTFLNKASLRRALDQIPEGYEVVIDGSQTRFIDVDALEVIEDFHQEAKSKNIKLTLIGLPLRGSLPAREIPQIIPLKKQAL